MAKPFDKPWLSISDQIQKLQGYGLTISDVPAASAFLEHINYYRFCGYGLAFEKSRHVFLPGTTFEQVRSAYEFDRSLRDLVTESLEVIELDLRTTIAHFFGKKYGAFGYVSEKSFFHTDRHREWLSNVCAETVRSSELFVKHHKEVYQEFPNMPIWVATEIMSFNTLSKMYSFMWKDDKKVIAARYHVQPDILGTWLHHLVYVRNLCAHHSRLWDRIWAIKPNFPAGKNWESPLVPSNMRLFATLLIQSAILRYCLAERSFALGWRVRIEELLINRTPAAPNVIIKMDLPIDWQKHPLWIQP
jgi:abortive infection bacteriophage resistance protein